MHPSRTTPEPNLGVSEKKLIGNVNLVSTLISIDIVWCSYTRVSFHEMSE